MEEDSSRMIVRDEQGNEYELEIILTFEDGGKNYALFRDAGDPDSEVYAYTYDEEGNMDQVIDEEEREMCAEVLDAFQNSEETDGKEA